MKYVSGKILTEEGFIEGYIGFERRKIKEKNKGNPPKKPISNGLIVPSFINFHTHIGDSFIRNKDHNLPRDIEKLVAPPDGLKHKFLKNANQFEIVDGMEESIDIMLKTGTKFFCDFREKGIMGICELKTALRDWKISSIILSRPENLRYDKKEIDLILKNSDGIGLSSISDWNFKDIKKIAEDTKKKNKIFALHASERIREDINKIIELNPDFLVHMNMADEHDLKKVKEKNIPIVICPRSNDFFKKRPNYELLKKNNNTILIGTDNCMINEPNIIDEIKLIREQTNVFSLDELLKMISISPRKVLNPRADILCLNSPADLVVLDEKSLKVLYVTTGGPIRGVNHEN